MPEPIVIIKKKFVKGHAGHGGSWKVAYADFVTSMMAFFMVMWLMNMTQAQKDLVQGYFNDPLGFASTTPKARTLLTLDGMPKPKPNAVTVKGTGNDSPQVTRSEEKLLQQVERQLRHELNSDPHVRDLAENVKISLTDEGLLIEFIEAQGAVFFESGSSVIRPEAARLIKTFAPILAHSGHALQVQGHTDSEPFGGTFNRNWQLSSERAVSLCEALENDGLPDRQVKGVTAYGSTRLLDENNPISFRNRRVTILLPKNDSGYKPYAPADGLRDSIGSDGEPQAVVIRPGKPNLLTNERP